MAALEEMAPKPERRAARPIQSSTDSNGRSNEDTDASDYNTALHDKMPAAAVSRAMNTSSYKRSSKRTKFDTDWAEKCF